LKIKKEFNDGAVRMMMELENQLKMFTDVKNKQYAEAFVNYLLNLEAQAGNKQMELPSDMKKKLDRYRKNGGVQVYEMTRKNILESASNAQMIIN
jgi:LDH2 family malate/lactate/ureidoglycolate dehydrogenase